MLNFKRSPFSFGVDASILFIRPTKIEWLAFVGLALAVLTTSLVSLGTKPDNIKAKAENLMLVKVSAYQELLQRGASDLRLDISSDDMIKSVAVIDVDGGFIFPPPGQITHFSDQPVLDDHVRLRQLSDFNLKIGNPYWARRDINGSQLYFCYTTFSTTCVIVSTPVLANALGINSSELLNSINHSVSSFPKRWLFIVIACAMATLIVSMFIRSRPTGVSRIAQSETNEHPVHFDAIQMGDMRIVPSYKQVIREGVVASIGERDLLILQYLNSRPNEVVSKNELYDAAWGREFVSSSRALEQHIITLRRKIDPKKSLPMIVETVHGQGYRFPSQNS